MKTKSLYFGNNPNIINHLENDPEIDLYVKESISSALSFLHENHDLECFILESPEETNLALEYIHFFVQHFKSQKLLFVIANNKSQQKELFVNGVCDVFLKETILGKIGKRIQYLKQHKDSFIKKLSSAEFKEFKLPVWKRTTDILFAITAITILSPLLLLIAVSIRLESKGKVIYAAKRIGTGYRIFDFYKFRSMYTGADKKVDQLLSQNQYVKSKDSEVIPADSSHPEDTVLFGDDTAIKEQAFLSDKKEKQEKSFFKMVNDPRITKVGRILRNTSLDELPQLFNILKGDMSVVGNRPLPLYEAETLTSDRWAKRFLAPSGLTGLWQVTKRGGSNELTPDERKQLDIDYANNYTFWGDLKIMFKTIPALVQHENV